MGLPSGPTKHGARDSRGFSGITCTTYTWDVALAHVALHDSITRNLANLFRYSRELHNVEGLVVGGRALVNVDDHGRLPPAAEKGLEEFGQLALSEGDVGALHSGGGGFGPPTTVTVASECKG